MYIVYDEQVLQEQHILPWRKGFTINWQSMILFTPRNFGRTLGSLTDIMADGNNCQVYSVTLLVISCCLIGRLDS